ncbi:hypothetical protein J7K25_02830 [bacterium]|nr:hypothetical protein [bacterium]
MSGYKITFAKYGKILIIKNYKFPAREKSFHTIIASDKNTRIEIEIIKPMSYVEATEYAESKYKIIKNLYGPQIIPYTGQLTTTTDCPPEKKPEEISIDILGKPTRVLLANATDRYVLGVWDDALIKTKAAFAMVYDEENQTIYQIIIFQPIKIFDQQKVLDILQGIKRIPEK